MAQPSAVGSKYKDPVCGMTVDPVTAKHRRQHAGQTYSFCCQGCAEKFQADPRKYLAPQPAPAMIQIAPAKPRPVPTANYVCPMCPEVRRSKPGPCPSCGMALEPEMPTAGTRTEYTCPMHPEIVRPGPGQLPDLRHGAGTTHRRRTGRRKS